MAHRLERSDHQSGSDEQHNCERDLNDDERAAREVAILARALRSGAAQRADNVRAHGADGWNRAEQQSGGNRCGAGEQRDAPVDRDIARTRQGGWGEPEQRAQRRICERESDCAAERPERDAFRKHLERQPSASGAQRRADRELLLAPVGAHEQQVRDVRAGDQEHESDRPHQHPQHGANVADHRVPENRREPRALEQLQAPAERDWILVHCRRDQPYCVGGRLIDRRATFEPRDSLEAEVAEAGLIPIEPQRRDHRRRTIHEAERVGHHADDVARSPVKDDAPPDHAAIRTELRSPVTGHEDDRFGAARRVVLRRKRAAEHGRDAERPQRSVGRLNRPHFFRLAGAGDARCAGPPQADAIERLCLVSVREHQERRRTGVLQAESWGVVIQRDKLFRPRIRQRLEQHTVDDAEHRRVGSDAEREGEHRDAGKHGDLPQAAEGVPEPHGA